MWEVVMAVFPGEAARGRIADFFTGSKRAGILKIHSDWMIFKSFSETPSNLVSKYLKTVFCFRKKKKMLPGIQ